MHFSSVEEAAKLPTENQRKSEDLSHEQKTLIIMDVFTRKMTVEVFAISGDDSILAKIVPANMTKFYQQLDLTVNGYAKIFAAKKKKKKIDECHLNQISKQLDNGVTLVETDVKIQLSPLY